jgi:hypothetical protein
MGGMRALCFVGEEIGDRNAGMHRLVCEVPRGAEIEGEGGMWEGAEADFARATAEAARHHIEVLICVQLRERDVSPGRLLMRSRAPRDADSEAQRDAASGDEAAHGACAEDEERALRLDSGELQRSVQEVAGVTIEADFAAKLTRGRDCEVACRYDVTRRAGECAANLAKNLRFAEDDGIEARRHFSKAEECLLPRPAFGRRTVTGAEAERLDALAAFDEHALRVVEGHRGGGRGHVGGAEGDRSPGAGLKGLKRWGSRH